jgi:hypothetical protein
MMHDVRRRFWVQITLATVSALLFVVTLVWNNWIEIIFRVDPDHGSGWLEWVIVVATAMLTGALSVGARREWHRAISRSAAGEGAA